MYLDGQLPYGPASSNTGGQQTLDGASALWGNPDLFPIPVTSDPSGGPDNTAAMYTVPQGGSDLVSPSIATADGIVQFPMTSPTGNPKFSKMRDSSECAGTGMSGIGAMDPATYEMHYGKPAPDPQACISMQCGKTPQAGNEQLNIDCGNFGYALARSCDDPTCAPFLPIPGCSPAAAAALQTVTKTTPPPNYVRPAAPAPLDVPCGGYGSGGILSSLQNNALRSTLGMGACCQSGYQAVDSPVVDQGNPALPFILAGLALLVLTGDRR
jgi:hypothetical protein